MGTSRTVISGLDVDPFLLASLASLHHTDRRLSDRIHFKKGTSGGQMQERTIKNAVMGAVTLAMAGIAGCVGMGGRDPASHGNGASLPPVAVENSSGSFLRDYKVVRPHCLPQSPGPAPGRSFPRYGTPRKDPCISAAAVTIDLYCRTFVLLCSCLGLLNMLHSKKYSSIPLKRAQTNAKNPRSGFKNG